MPFDKVTPVETPKGWQGAEEEGNGGQNGDEPTSLFQRVIGYIVSYGDRYGETEAAAAFYKAAMGPKTLIGCFCSCIFGGFVAALIGMLFWQFQDTSNYSLNLGPDTEITGNYDPDEWPGLPGDPAAEERYAKILARGYANRPTMYLPTLLADLSIDIQFFEDAAPGSLQKIEVIDNTGYEPYFASSLKDDPPGVQSVIQDAQMPFESFAEELQEFESPRPAAEFDLKTILGVQATHEELAEPLKAIYSQEGIIGSHGEFSSHTAHLFVRFKENELKKLKSCQLQAYLFNTGVSKWLQNADPQRQALKDRRIQTAEYFPTLTSSQATYAPSNFVKADWQGYRWKYTLSMLEKAAAKVPLSEELQVIHLSSKISEAHISRLASASSHGPEKLNIKAAKKPEASELMSWKFGVNYVNNFLHTFQEYQCDGAPLGYHHFAYGAPLPNGNIVNVTCLEDECDTFSRRMEITDKPFYVLLNSIWGVESAQMIYRNGRLERVSKGSIDHSKAAPGWWTQSSFQDFPSDLTKLGWRCNPDEYFKGDKICNCECGAYDPDCGEYMGDTFAHIENCRPGEFCSFTGHCMLVDPVQLAEIYWGGEEEEEDDSYDGDGEGGPDGRRISEAGDHDSEVEDENLGRGKNITLPVSISPPCSKVYMPGGQALRGFVGTAAAFAEVKSTGSCPGDSLFNFTAQRTLEGKYVCNMESSGIMNMMLMEWAQTNDVEVVAGEIEQLRRKDAMEVSIEAGASAPFPSGHGNLTVILNEGHGNSERLIAWNITPPGHRSRQRMMLSSPGKHSRPRFSHISKGLLLSAIDGSSNVIHVLTDSSRDETKRRLTEEEEEEEAEEEESGAEDESVLHRWNESDEDAGNNSDAEDGGDVGNHSDAEDAGNNSDAEDAGNQTDAENNDGGSGGGIGSTTTSAQESGQSQRDSGTGDAQDGDEGTGDAQDGIGNESDAGNNSDAEDAGNQADAENNDVGSGGGIGSTDTSAQESGQSQSDSGTGDVDGDEGTGDAQDANSGGSDSDANTGTPGDQGATPAALFEPALNFDTRGPYEVYVDDPGGRLRVASATPRRKAKTKVQALKLAEPPSFSLGLRSYLIQEAKVGSTSVVVRRAGFHKVMKHTPFHMVLSRGTGVEAVKVTEVGGYANAWTCANEQFAGSDGCHCGCGIWDPDCGLDPSLPASTRPIHCMSEKSASKKNPESHSSHEDRFSDDWSDEEDFFEETEKTDSATYCLLDTNGFRTKKNNLPYQTRCVTSERRLLSGYDASAYKPIDLQEQSIEIFSEELSFNSSEELGHPGQLLEKFPYRTAVSAALSYQKDEEGNAIVNKEITISSVVSIRMMRPGFGPFLPADRFLPQGLETTTSPESLHATFALFMVPDRKSFSDVNFSLCPKISTARVMPKSGEQYGYDKWSLAEDRKMKVNCRGPQDMEIAACLHPAAYKASWNNTYRRACLTEMPPTATFGYTTTQHVNEKWKGRNTYTSDLARPSGFRAPELNLDVSHLFHFSHSQDDEDVEKKFAAGRNVDGDMDQHGKRHLFFGAPLYRGRSLNGTNASTKGFPANHPFLKPALKIKLAPSAVTDIQKARPLLWYWAHKGLTEDVVKKFQTVDIAWDTSSVGGSAGQLLLMPGQQYTLTAEVELWPVIRRPMFLADFFEHFENFGYRIGSTTVTVNEMGSLQKRQAEVRVKITFATVEATVREHNMPFENFLTSASAATGFFALGVYALLALQCMTCKRHPYHKWALRQQAAAMSDAGEVPDEAETLVTSLKPENGGQDDVTQLPIPPNPDAEAARN